MELAMTGFDYAAKKATAERLLERFGKTGTLSRPGAATGPAWEATPGTPATSSVKCVELMGTIGNQAPSVASRGARRILISTAGGVTPAKGNKLTVDGITHTLKTVDALNLGGVVLLFEVEIET